MKIAPDYEIGMTVSVNWEDIVNDGDFVYTKYRLYMRANGSTSLKGEIINIKTRNWLGFKLKQPIFTIECKTNRNQYYFYATKVTKVS